MFRKLLLGVIGISLVFLLPTMGRSQSTFGSITGTVADPSGAIVPGAEVQVINEGTGTVRKVSTSSAGVFNVPNLDIGNYRVRVSAKGFTTYERGGLHLTANQILNINAQLTVGATSTVLQVQAATPVITTEANDISGSMNHQSIEQMPLVGRHDGGTGGVYTYLTLTAGAAAVPTSSTPIVQGTRSQVGILPTMDGIAVMAYPQGAGPVQPSLEGVQELKMETAVAPAEFPTAGNLQVVTKSGTNEYHGGVFWDYNGSSLNARNFFSPKVPFRVYNNFGASAGGPIMKNKLFFFADYEASREAAKTVSVESVPLPAWTTGNFSSLSKQLIDPTTGQAFQGNIIPPGRISTVSQNIQNYVYPAPNTGAPGVVANNWTAQFPGTTGFTVFNNIDSRADYNVTDRDTIFGRISWRRLPLLVPGIYPLHRVQTRYGKSAVFSWNHILSPTAFNEFRFGGTYHRNHYMANVVGSDLLQQFGIQGISTTGVNAAPLFNITGVTPFNPDSFSDTFQDNPETTLEWIDNLSWNRGRHFMKFGFDAIRDRLGGNNINSNAYGDYAFTGAYTGFGYADFLLGIPQTTTVAIPNPNRNLRGTTWGMYAQDQFKVSRSLTLNYGVRWELEEPYTDTRGALYTFDPATGGLVVPDQGVNLINPFFPTNIPIATASQAGYPANSLVNMNKNTIEPRIGFAYKLFGGDKTVVRGGYGIYSNLIYGTLARSQLSGGPFSGSVTYTNSIVNGAPLFSFPSPFLSSGSTSTQNVNSVNPNLKTPYTQQWELSVERQIGQYGLRISYMGARSDQLVYRRNLNLPAPSTTLFTTSERTYPLYNQVIYADSGGNEFYNALELAAEKKYGRNLTLSSGFTWAKDLTDTQDSGGGGTTFGGQVIQNQFDRAIEKANNPLTVPHRFYAYAMYALPVGQGQRFFSGMHGPAQQIFGGWRTTWTVVMQSGQWFSPSFSGFDVSNTNTIGGIPDRIANGNLSNGTVSQWFDPAAFKIPGCPDTKPICSSKERVNVGRFGNSGFNILSGPPIRNLDFGLAKDFNLLERAKLQFTMTMANALNHPNFNAPSSNISSPGTVATIGGQARPLLSEPGPREIDFGLRLNF